jgi:hypothetical protein
MLLASTSCSLRKSTGTIATRGTSGSASRSASRISTQSRVHLVCPGHTVHQCVVHLVKQREAPVTQAIDQMAFPQGLTPIKWWGMQLITQGKQLAHPSGQTQRRVSQVVVDVYVVVVSPAQPAGSPPTRRGMPRVRWRDVPMSPHCLKVCRANSGPEPSGGRNNCRAEECMGRSLDSSDRNTTASGRANRFIDASFVYGKVGDNPPQRFLANPLRAEGIKLLKLCLPFGEICAFRAASPRRRPTPMRADRRRETRAPWQRRKARRRLPRVFRLCV